MRKILIFSAILMVAWACKSSSNLYSGPQYVMFADTVTYLPISSAQGESFDIPIAVTTKSSVDRTYAVQVVSKKGNAIEGHHFRLLTHNCVVKAGEMSSSIKVQGIYENIAEVENPRFTLQLVAPKGEIWDIYGDQTVVEMMRYCRFDMNDWVDDGGHYIFYATFPYGESMVQILVTATQIDDRRIEFHDMFDSLTTVKMRFDDRDPFSPVMVVNEQYAFSDPSYGKISIQTSAGSPNYYYQCNKFMIVSLECTLEKVGSFGTYTYLLEKISSVKAAEIRNGGYSMGASGAFGASQASGASGSAMQRTALYRDFSHNRVEVPFLINRGGR